MLTQGARALARTTPARTFTTSPARLNTATSALPAQRPVGALRGGCVLFPSLFPSPSLGKAHGLTTGDKQYRLFGFFLGSSIAAGGIYYYAVQEYKTSNELLTEDIYVRVCI
jgi:hypothetical protein